MNEKGEEGSRRTRARGTTRAVAKGQAAKLRSPKLVCTRTGIGARGQLRYLVGKGAARGRRAAAGLVALHVAACPRSRRCEIRCGGSGPCRLRCCCRRSAWRRRIRTARQRSLRECRDWRATDDREGALLRKLEVVGRLADIVGVPLDADAAEIRVLNHVVLERDEGGLALGLDHRFARLIDDVAGDAELAILHHHLGEARGPARGPGAGAGAGAGVTAATGGGGGGGGGGVAGSLPNWAWACTRPTRGPRRRRGRTTSREPQSFEPSSFSSFLWSSGLEPVGSRVFEARQRGTCASPLAPLWTSSRITSSNATYPNLGFSRRNERFHGAVLPPSTSLGARVRLPRSDGHARRGGLTRAGASAVTRRSWVKSVLVGGVSHGAGRGTRVGAEDRIHRAAWDSGGPGRLAPWQYVVMQHLARRVAAPDAQGARHVSPRRTSSKSPNSSTATSRRCAPRCAAIFAHGGFRRARGAFPGGAREPVHRAPEGDPRPGARSARGELTRTDPSRFSSDQEHGHDGLLPRREDFLAHRVPRPLGPRTGSRVARDRSGTRSDGRLRGGRRRDHRGDRRGWRDGPPRARARRPQGDRARGGRATTPPPISTQREEEMLPLLFQDRAARTTADLGHPRPQGRGVGGTTVHNTNLCKRTPPRDPRAVGQAQLRRRRVHRQPISSLIFDENRGDLSVTEIPEAQQQREQRRAPRGVEALGLRGGPLQHNRVGCRRAASASSAARTTPSRTRPRCSCRQRSPRRGRGGGATVMSDVRALRIEHRRVAVSGASAVATDRRGVRPSRRLRLRAKVVVLAGKRRGRARARPGQRPPRSARQHRAGLRLHPGGVVAGRFDEKLDSRPRHPAVLRVHRALSSSRRGASARLDHHRPSRTRSAPPPRSPASARPICAHARATRTSPCSPRWCTTRPRGGSTLGDGGPSSLPHRRSRSRAARDGARRVRAHPLRGRRPRGGPRRRSRPVRVTRASRARRRSRHALVRPHQCRSCRYTRWARCAWARTRGRALSRAPASTTRCGAVRARRLALPDEHRGPPQISIYAFALHLAQHVIERAR